MNLMSSTLLVEDTGVPFDELQAEQIARYRAAWAKAGWEREPRISVSRSVLPIVTDLDRLYFGDRARQRRRRPGRLPRGDARALREELHRRARRDRGRAEPRRGRPRGGHAAAHRAEPARRRVQRAPARDVRAPHRARARLGTGRSGAAGARAQAPAETSAHPSQRLRSPRESPTSAASPPGRGRLRPSRGPTPRARPARRPRHRR